LKATTDKKNDSVGCVHILAVFCRLWAFAIGAAGVVAFAYIGVSAIATRSLHSSIGFHVSGRWFPGPLYGFSAALAGASFLCLAACLSTIIVSYPPLAARLPSWISRIRWWWFFIGWALLKWTATYMARA
jgi:hypothetical protein